MIPQFSRNDLSERQDPRFTGQPISKHDQVRSGETTSAERQNEWPPVLWMVQVVLQFQEVSTGPFEQQPTIQIPKIGILPFIR